MAESKRSPMRHAKPVWNYKPQLKGVLPKQTPFVPTLKTRTEKLVLETVNNVETIPMARATACSIAS